MDFSRNTFVEDTSPRLIRNLAFLGVGIGVLMLAFNWWVYTHVSADPLVQKLWLFICLLSVGLGVLYVLFSRKLILMCEQRIEEHSRIIESLRESHETLDQIFHTASDGIRVVRNDFEVEMFNDAFAALCGLSREKLVGKKCYEQFPSANCHTEKCPIQILKKGQDSFEVEIIKKRSDGDEVLCLLSVGSLRNEDGEFTSVVQNFTDVSDIKRVEKTLRQAKEAAELSNEAKNEFMANMSHEIRTPLNGIMGMTDLVLASELVPEQRRFLDMVKKSADRLLHVVNGILDFSKIEGGTLAIENIPFKLGDVIDSSLKILAEKADEKGLELVYHIGRDVPADFIGDPSRLRQIIVNLVRNSITFTEEGEVRVSVAIDEHKRDEQDIVLHFTVADTGIGIVPEKQEIIFKAFQQVDGSSSRKYGGIGLGLTICAQLVEIMGGEIWLESGPEGGTRFHFTACFACRPDQNHRVDLVPVDELKKLTCLLVASHTTSRILMYEILQEHLHEVQAVNSVESALLIATRQTFDIVVFDVEQVEKEPFSLAEKLRDASNEAKIIMITASGKRGDALRCVEIGIASYLLKPVGKLEIVSAIRAVVSGDAYGADEILITRHTIRENKQAFHILLAEDEEINRTLAVELLGHEGWRVSTANNGKEVLDALKNNHFHLILMDIQMPEMDGLEAVRIIREQEEGERIPVIALTAHVMAADRQKCLKAGMDGYVEKPINMDVLRAEIERVLGKDPDMKSGKVSAKKSLTKAIDYDTFLYESCNGKEELAKKLLSHLLYESGPKWLDEAEDAVAQRDEKRIRTVCHSLKGTAATVSAFPFAEAGARLGTLAREGAMDKTPAALEDLKNEFVKIQMWAQKSKIDI